MYWFLKILIYTLLLVGSPLAIFLDFHKKSNVWKGVVYIGVFISVIIILKLLVENFGLKLLYGMPVFAAIPFLVIFFTGNKRSKK